MLKKTMEAMRAMKNMRELFLLKKAIKGLKKRKTRLEDLKGHRFMVLQWKKVKFNKKWILMMQEEDKVVRLRKLFSEVAAEHDARHARNWSNAIAQGRIMF